jgi:hypothetical protein
MRKPTAGMICVDACSAQEQWRRHIPVNNGRVDGKWRAKQALLLLLLLLLLLHAQLELRVWDRPVRALCVAFEHEHVGGKDAAVTPARVELSTVLVEGAVALYPVAGLGVEVQRRVRDLVGLP